MGNQSVYVHTHHIAYEGASVVAADTDLELLLQSKPKYRMAEDAHFITEWRGGREVRRWEWEPEKDAWSPAKLLL